MTSITASTSRGREVKCIHVHAGPEEAFQFDEEQHVNGELCLRLEEGEEVLVASDTPFFLRRLTVISEARTVEVRRQNGEYVATLAGARSAASDEDFQVFQAESAELNQRISGGQNDALVIRPKTTGAGWLLAVAIAVQPALPTIGRFDMTRLDAMLADVPLSDKAKDFKKIFTDFQRSKAATLTAANTFAVPPAGDITLSSLATSTFATKDDLRALEFRLTSRLDEQERKLDRIVQLLEQMSK